MAVHDGGQMRACFNYHRLLSTIMYRLIGALMFYLHNSNEKFWDRIFERRKTQFINVELIDNVYVNFPLVSRRRSTWLVGTVFSRFSPRSDVHPNSSASSDPSMKTWRALWFLTAEQQTLSTTAVESSRAVSLRRACSGSSLSCWSIHLNLEDQSCATMMSAKGTWRPCKLTSTDGTPWPLFAWLGGRLCSLCSKAFPSLKRDMPYRLR